MMGLRRLDADGPYTGLFGGWIEEWSQFFEPCNWRTFHPFKLELEDDRIMGGVEMTLILVGVGFRLRWNHTRTEQVEEITAAVASIKDDLIAMPDPLTTSPAINNLGNEE